MAKYGSNSVQIDFDNSGGTPVDMSNYIHELGPIKVASAEMQESHAFGDAWKEFLATGVRMMEPFDIVGFYDDTATTGPDAIFNDVADGPADSTRTITVTWGGSKTTSVECWISAYQRAAVRGELHLFTVTLTPTGTVTEA